MIRRHSANGTVRPTPIVKVDVSGEPGSCLRDTAVGSQIHFLVLDGLPQAFDEHVVAPATLAVHRDADVVVSQHRCESQAGEPAILLQESMPPDPDLVDLIEQAFLEGQIDGLKADLAYLWMQAHRSLDSSPAG